MIEARSILLLCAGNTLLLLAIIFRVWVSMRGTIRSLQRENADLILRLDAIDAAAITAGVTLRDARAELSEAQHLFEQSIMNRCEEATGYAAEAHDSMKAIGDDLRERIKGVEDYQVSHSDRLRDMERAHADNKGPVQARGVVASRRAIMEMGGAKDLM